MLNKLQEMHHICECGLANLYIYCYKNIAFLYRVANLGMCVANFGYSPQNQWIIACY